MKRIFLHIILLLFFIANAFAQKPSFLPRPLTTITDTCTFGGPDSIIFTITTTDLLCNSDNSGTATVTITKGTPPYTYVWNGIPSLSTASVTGLSAGTKNLDITDGAGINCVTFFTITEPGALVVNLSPPPMTPSCFGTCDGRATAAPVGGTPPFTYSWSTSPVQTTALATGLCAGTHTVTVIDANGCIRVRTVTLTQPFPLAANGSSTNINCFGNCNGSATVTPTGGTTPYTYSWSGGGTTSAIAGKCAGTYTCTVSDTKSCVTTYVANIIEPAALTVVVTGSNLACNAVCTGSVTASPSGGTGAYTYAWTPGGCVTSSCTGLCAGTYTLTLRDANGCSATRTVTLTQPAAFTASITANPNPLNCNGDCDGTALASLNGGTATYSYFWSTGATTPSITGLCAGPYSLTATDALACTATASVTFSQPSTLSVTITSVDPSCSGICNGSISAAAAGGTAGYTYAWQPGGQTTSAISALCAGGYTITVTDNKGCSNVQTVTLTATSTLFANAFVIKNASCSGVCDGSASAAPSGGTAPFTYLWTGGATTQTVTGLCANPALMVTVTDANGCPDVDILSITEPSVLSSSIASSTSSCISCTGTASISTSGGTLPYTYLWAPGGQSTSSATGLCIGTYTVSVTDANGCTNSIPATIDPVVIITISVSGTTVSCAGSCDGIATATPSGGGTPYTYLWTSAPAQTTQSATGLCAGSYTVTVGDINGCASTGTVTFAAPAALSTTMSSTSSSCGVCNGTATVAPSGGTGAYTYSWSGFPVQTTATATGLCMGNYTVVLSDANNCTTTNTVSVGNIPAISDNASTTLAACGVNDGAICVAPSGGTPAFTYLWAPGAETVSCVTGLGAGIYTVTITDASGCSHIASIPISNVGGPTVTVTSSVSPTCNADCDGSISISATGPSTPFAYLWNSGQTTTTISALCAGTYIVQVTDANATPCTTFASITLTDPPQMNSNPVITNVSCNGGSNGGICLSPTGGTSPYTYQWLGGGQTTSCLAGLLSGTYTVVLTDNIGCDDTILIPVSEPAILSVTIAATNVNCNGNADGTATAVVTGGTTLYNYAWNTGAPIPSIVGLSPGTYSLTVTDNNGCTATASVTISEPAALTTTITSANITCNTFCDGAASIAASGGTSPYSYFWLPGGQTTSAIAGLCPGNYVAIVIDANICPSTKTVTITQPAVVTATITPTNATCFGGCNGTASASVSGGTGAYTYSWNPGALTGASVTGLCVNSYTLTTSDANGCTTINFFSISAPTVLQANITNTQTSCTSTCDGTATSAPVGGTGAYTYQWSNGQTNATATGLCVGTYTLILSDANGCTIAQTTSITSPAAMSQSWSVTGATCNICNGTITVVGSGGTSPYSYFWSTGATGATVTGLCAGVYIDTVMDANGCISVDTIALSNTTGPAISLTGTNSTCFGACNGTATVATATGNGPPWGYSWSFTTPTQTTQTATGLCPNQYFASVTDLSGCVTIANINITQPAQLAPNAVPSNVTCLGICDGGIVTAATGGTGAYTYSWLPGGATTSSISSQCAGTYTLTLRDANNCSLTSTITIGQNAILTSTLTSTNNSCNASCNGTASITIAGGTSPYTYAWVSGGQTTTSVTGLCANTYTITTTDAIGCVNITTVTITEPAVLAANITPVNPTCTSLCNGSASSAASGGTAPYTYLWNPGNLTTSSITGQCAGTFTLTLRDANNCLSTNTITLTDPPLLTATYSITNASCANTCDGSINLTPSGGTGAYTFAWSNSAITEDVTGLCPGIYSVTITDANGCSIANTMTVAATTLVIAVASNDTSFCLGGTATLTSTSINAISIGWYQLPAWSLVGTTITVAVSPPAGTTNYALIATNGVCSDTDTVAVTVNNYPNVITANAVICSGNNGTLCASGASVYQWYQLPAWTPVPTTGACITVVSPGVGVTNYAVIGMNGLCADTAYASLTVLAMPVANAGNDTAFCIGGTATLCGTLSQNAVSFNWHILPLWTLIASDTCITVTPTTTTSYALLVSNGSCFDSDTATVTIYASPPADAGLNVTILNSGSTILNGAGGGTYLWSPAAGLSSTTIANPTASPTVTTVYKLLVTNANGCTGIDSVTVTIVRAVIVNDGLSPNGDGINDDWIIPNIEQFPNALVEVYNRWGERLFHSIGYKEKWDCTYKGKELPVGTYYYIINLNSDLFPDPITGPITILR